MRLPGSPTVPATKSVVRLKRKKVQPARNSGAACDGPMARVGRDRPVVDSIPICAAGRLDVEPATHESETGRPCGSPPAPSGAGGVGPSSWGVPGAVGRADPEVVDAGRHLARRPVVPPLDPRLVADRRGQLRRDGTPLDGDLHG